MTRMYWLRVIMMAAILVAVLWSMRKLNPNRPVLETINLCPTRITWIETVKDSVHIEQTEMRWMRIVNSTTAELEPIAAEKWFSNLCTISSTPGKGGVDFEPVLKIGYVSGITQQVLKGRNGEFQVDGRTFVSQDLDEALRILPTLPEATPPGHP